jgi:hypothetical protein
MACRSVTQSASLTVHVFRKNLRYITFFAILGVELFADQYHTYVPSPGADEFPIPGAFDNVGIAFLRLYVLFSTENYPEIALPAFQHNEFSIMYFGEWCLFYLPFFGGTY